METTNISTGSWIIAPHAGHRGLLFQVLETRGNLLRVRAANTRHDAIISGRLARLADAREIAAVTNS